MKFNITGKLVRTVTTEIIYHLECGEVEIQKKDVVETLDLPQVVDGDPTHWYEEVEEALKRGCIAKLTESTPIEKQYCNSYVTEKTQIVSTEDDWEIEDVTWS